jgi:hypothetical protein
MVFAYHGYVARAHSFVDILLWGGPESVKNSAGESSLANTYPIFFASKTCLDRDCIIFPMCIQLV